MKTTTSSPSISRNPGKSPRRPSRACRSPLDRQPSLSPIYGIRALRSFFTAASFRMVTKATRLTIRLPFRSGNTTLPPPPGPNTPTRRHLPERTLLLAMSRYNVRQRVQAPIFLRSVVAFILAAIWIRGRLKTGRTRLLGSISNLWLNTRSLALQTMVWIHCQIVKRLAQMASGEI